MKIYNLNLKEKINNLQIDEDTIIKSILIVQNSELIENHIIIEIPKPKTKSEILFKLAILGQSKVSINPIVRIEKGMIGVECKLKIQVLCDTDLVNLKITPSLECMEPDVKLSHSLTISTFDRNQLEYLFSKGLNLDQSKLLLIEAFTSDII